MTALTLSEAEVRELAGDALRETARDGPRSQTLSVRGHAVSSRKVIRFERDADQTMILKFWQHYKLRYRVRQWLRVSSAQCEVRNLLAMSALGIGVPTPLGFAHLGVTAHQRFNEVVVMEDLGECTSGTDHVRALIAAGRDSSLQGFEDQVTAMAATLVRGGVVDRDFTVDNIVLCGERIRRIDVEIARRVMFPSVSSSLCSEMFGPLLATYTWAVHPEATDVVPRLMRKLKGALKPSRLSWARTEYVYDKVMRTFGNEHGGLTRMELPWSAI
jgi:tRNA A-37 threonylcarbamoyl transferase component Bud32